MTRRAVLSFVPLVLYSTLAWTSPGPLQSRNVPSMQSMSSVPTQIDANSLVVVPEANAGLTSGETFKHLVPPMWNTTCDVDIRFQWSLSDEPRAVADDIMSRLPRRAGDATETQRKILSQSIKSFSSYCSSHLRNCVKFKGRLLATRGGEGKKCPNFHVDHVPVRWIQSLHGPGCQWVDEEYVNWDVLLSYVSTETLDSRERNRLVVDSDARIRQAPPGEALILVGNRFPEFRVDGDRESKSPLPVVHRSPEILLPWQGRVLLTMDIDVA